MREKAPYSLIFFLSALTLQLEFLQTRILSFALWHHFVYIVITMALLGFAASGTALYFSRRLGAMSHEAFYSFCLMGFSLTSWLSSRFASLPANQLFALEPNAKTVLILVVAYTVCMAPYLFAGLAIGGTFIRYPRRTGLLYAANLAGSGLGCLSFVLLVSPVGATRLLALSSLLALAPLAVLARRWNWARGLAAAWALVMAAALFSGEDSVFNKIVPEKNKQYEVLYKDRTRYEYTEWNPISRIDVIHSVDKPRSKFILMDGDAMAYLTAFDDFKDSKVSPDRQGAYSALGRTSERTLIIGAGGGLDVMVAYFEGSKHIDAVEINPTTYKLDTETYSSFLGDLFKKDNVKLFLGDGRAFARRTKNQYDVITLYATDTLLALSSGAYTLLDNYLYTKDAFKDYLKLLSDDGCIQIVRWYYDKKDRETLRVFTTMLEAMKELGYKDPLSHVLVLGFSNQMANVMVKKTPFTQADENRVGDFMALARSKGSLDYGVLYSAGLLRANPGLASANGYFGFAQSFLAGKQAEFYDAYPFKVSPVTDDSPFFYQYTKWRGGEKGEQFISNYYDRIRGSWHVFVLTSLLLQAAVLSAVFVLLPLVLSRASLGGLRPGSFSLVYFASIGLAFMFMEMSVIQKFCLFLGTPIYSMAATVPAILVFAGLGSLASRKLENRKANLPALATLAAAVLVLLLSWCITPVTDHFLGQARWIRVLIVLACLAPVSFCMGMPFPLGLKAASGLPGKHIPWAWAINGSASVMASVLAVLLAMQSGFSFVLGASVLWYAVASLGAFLFLKPGAPASAPSA